jgi:cytochrome o ubiquinol oxidase subunit IV
MSEQSDVLDGEGTAQGHDGDAPPEGPEPSEGDRAPGFEEEAQPRIGPALRNYLIGLVLASVLTVAAFWAARTHLIFGPGVPLAIVVLAIAQMGIHLVFFLHLTSAPDNTNNALALAFGVLIAGLVVFGSVWIMTHLNARMTTMPQLLQMQQSGI